MQKEIVRWIKTISDEALDATANGLATWLAQENGASVTESRTKALLLAMNALDETTLNDFRRVMGNAATVRIALVELVGSGELKVSSFRPAPSSQSATPSWLALALMAYAYKLDYPVENLDPGSPPNQFSPAGQVVHQTAAWLRAQVLRSATERDKLARALAYVASETGRVEQETGRKSTPVTRSSVPVRYFEHNEPVAIDPNRPLPQPSTSAIERGVPIEITIEDVPTAPTPTPLRIEAEPAIRIVGESRVVPRPAGQQSSLSRAAQRASDAAAQAAQAVRENVTRENVQRAVNTAVDSADRAFDNMRRNAGPPVPNTGRRTRLLVSVMDYPNGHPLPAVQIGVRVKGSKKEVAGTTNDSGLFRCSVPVKHGAGVTYEVTCHWPHGFGGNRERKRITLNAERTEFELAFYSRLVP
ncbi:MAG: hypothetical protein ACPG8W_12505 [Candidatus Promineifilaceae bacterium]